MNVINDATTDVIDGLIDGPVGRDDEIDASLVKSTWAVAFGTPPMSRSMTSLLWFFF